MTKDEFERFDALRLVLTEHHNAIIEAIRRSPSIKHPRFHYPLKIMLEQLEDIITDLETIKIGD